MPNADAEAAQPSFWRRLTGRWHRLPPALQVIVATLLFLLVFTPGVIIGVAMGRESRVRRLAALSRPGAAH